MCSFNTKITSLKTTKRWPRAVKTSKEYSCPLIVALHGYANAPTQACDYHHHALYVWLHSFLQLHIGLWSEGLWWWWQRALPWDRSAEAMLSAAQLKLWQKRFQVEGRKSSLTRSCLLLAQKMSRSQEIRVRSHMGMSENGVYPQWNSI